ncbi:uncharacterized protein C9orf85 homolog [Microcaecilia unicolor]|uniref:Uncharacterized protein C9orf85 homolog n=1 Tax=Microcaecilia unicolor TaxID=1415580 RepID=A0A6P7XB42_9AMPH|nr:uncharacterized protein C9orf85 homolog [Microcaecilia unicolor]
MSSQRGNVSRTRPQKHRNVTVFKNDKFDSSSQTKKINAKLHDGVCQRCKDILEWRVKFSKYKALSQPKKCVKCLQKTVKDAYHLICRPCACRLNLCAKCGKAEEVILPFGKGPEKMADEPNPSGGDQEDVEDLSFDMDLNSSDEDNEDFTDKELKEENQTEGKSHQPSKQKGLKDCSV